MRILIIDNNIDRDAWGSPALQRFARSVSGATIEVRRAPHDDLPKSPVPYDRIIVSGSKTAANEDAPWIESLLAFIRASVNEGKPYFGICYGHQALARALGDKSLVRRAAQPEFGWTKIQLLDESPLSEASFARQRVLMKGLPREFYSFSSHFDEVSEPPPGMVTIAKSDACRIQAFAHRSKPVFGVQFHPEKTAEEGEETLRNRKKLGTPKKLLNPGRGAKLFEEEIGQKLFGNFLSL